MGIIREIVQDNAFDPKARFIRNPERSRFSLLHQFIILYESGRQRRKMERVCLFFGGETAKEIIVKIPVAFRLQHLPRISIDHIVRNVVSTGTTYITDEFSSIL